MFLNLRHQPWEYWEFVLSFTLVQIHRNSGIGCLDTLFRCHLSASSDLSMSPNAFPWWFAYEPDTDDLMRLSFLHLNTVVSQQWYIHQSNSWNIIKIWFPLFKLALHTVNVLGYLDVIKSIYMYILGQLLENAISWCISRYRVYDLVFKQLLSPLMA